MPDYEKIAREAEADLNTYQAKTGAARPPSNNDAGVDTNAEKKFRSAGAKVAYWEELSSNQGFNKRIPPQEGGDVDIRGKQARGLMYDGVGGPQEKVAEFYARHPGENDLDVADDPVPEIPPGRFGDEILGHGQFASVANVGKNPPGPGGSNFKGSDYYTPEDVPDSIAAEGRVPPESVTQASRETEGYSSEIHPSNE